MKCVAFCNCSGKDQISHYYLILLDQRYDKYLNSVCSKVNYCTSLTGENEKVHTPENQLLIFKSTINLCQVYCEGILLEQIIK